MIRALLRTALSEAGGPGASQQLMVNQIGTSSDTVSAGNGLAASFS